jgi:hypothetical protein
MLSRARIAQFVWGDAGGAPGGVEVLGAEQFLHLAQVRSGSQPGGMLLRSSDGCAGVGGRLRCGRGGLAEGVESSAPTGNRERVRSEVLYAPVRDRGDGGQLGGQRR